MKNCFSVRSIMNEIKKTREDVRKGRYTMAQMRTLSALFNTEIQLFSQAIKANKLAGVRMDPEDPKLKNITIE